MKKHVGIFRGWMIVVFLAIPLLGGIVFPEYAYHGVGGGRQRSKAEVQQSVSVQISTPSDVQRGQDLFMGYVHFQNDGPPCMGCHNVGSNGLLGGGAMGPDLTNVSRQRSQEEIASILSNKGSSISPVMQPIFSEHPLTETEQADLIAFLNSSVGQPESNQEFLVIGISLAGFAAAVLLLGFVYRGRLRGVRKALVGKAYSRQL
jgi:mono/diheme cytochrome c family protein